MRIQAALTVFVVASLVAAAQAGAQEGEKKVSISQVPAKVKTAILKEVGDGKLVDIGEFTDGEKKLYEIEMVLNGEEFDVLFSPDGKVLKKTSEGLKAEKKAAQTTSAPAVPAGGKLDPTDGSYRFTLDTLPAPVRETFLKQAGSNVVKGFSMEMKDGKPIFDCDVFIDGKKYAVIADADGKLISKPIGELKPEQKQKAERAAKAGKTKEGKKNKAAKGDVAKSEKKQKAERAAKAGKTKEGKKNKAAKGDVAKTEKEVKLPEAVDKAFKAAFPKGEIEKLDAEEENGVMVYDFEFKNGEVEQETDIAGDGTILEVTLVIKARDLPAPARKAMKKAAAGAKLGRIERIDIRYETKDGKVVKLANPVTHYAAEYGAGSESGEAVVTADGTIVEE